MIDHSPSQKRHDWLIVGIDHSPIILSAQINEYLLDCKVEGKAKTTVLEYERRLRFFLTFTGDKPVEQISKHDIRLYIISLQDRDLSASYVNANYRCLSAFFNWLGREGIITSSPMAGLKPPKLPKQTPKPFSEEDIARMLILCSGEAFLDKRNTAIILAFCDTGLRLSEMARIRLDDIDWTSGVIQTMGKGSRERVVRLGKDALKAVHRYRRMRNDNYPCLWVTESHRPLTKNGLQTAIKRLCSRAKITDAKGGAHSFRHFFATSSIRNGANLFYVQALLGHSTLQMTRRYASTIDSEKAVQAHDSFSPVAGLFKPRRPD